MYIGGNALIEIPSVEKLLEGYENRGIANQIIQMKIADYEVRHRGKRPAKIFVSADMFLKITGDIKCDVRVCASGENKLFEIPVYVFLGANGPETYFSDEEERN